MFSHRYKIYVSIAVMVVAVILIVLAFINFFQPETNIVEAPDKSQAPPIVRHPLNGQAWYDNSEFFTVAVMIDNAYDIRPQYGLSQADIIYEALAEANITRLMAIFASGADVDKLGPVRSARNYFMDWAEEYQGVYIHVGGSPSALKVIDSYNFEDINQIGAGEIYFWRDNSLNAPHNVFSSNSNWLRVGELKDLSDTSNGLVWNFTDATSTNQTIVNFNLDYRGVYDVDWKYNDKLEVYERWQTDDKFIYATGEQARADNIIVQIIPSTIVDDEARREMDTQSGGLVFIFNKLGKQNGEWKVIGGRTRFFDSDNNELQLVPGQTWVQVIDSEEDLKIAE